MLWKLGKSSINTQKKRAEREARHREEHEANQLWQLIQQNRREDFSQEASPHIAALTEISQAVHASFGKESAATRQEEAASRAAFAPIHAQLMNEIEASQHKGARHGVRREVTQQNALTRVLMPRQAVVRWTIAACLFLLAALGGHSIGSVSAAREFPVEAVVSDFDQNLHGKRPMDVVAQPTDNPRHIAQSLSRQTGMKVHLPAAHAGVQLVGARHHSMWNRPAVQTHYLKNGTHVALYQVREPRCALSELNEVDINGQLYYAGERNGYRVVVWRSGDNVMAIVTALSPSDTLKLARQIRNHNVER